MDYYAFPNSVYDQPTNLLAVLGSWWARDYAGRDQILAVVQGKSQVEQQSTLDLMELIASMSRFTVPIYHRDNWYPLYLKASEVNNISVSPVRYGDADTNYDEGVNYDVPKATQFFAFPLPEDLINVPVVMNRFADPTWLLTENIDYLTEPGVITFHNNPFDDVRVAKRPVYEAGVVVDTEALIWVYRGEWEWEHIYEQFAYVLGIKLQSSIGYRDLMNAIYDALIGGTTKTSIQNAVSAMTGVPLVKEAQETVIDITSDGIELIIITDQHVYKFGLAATPIVVVDQVVHRGEALTDALLVHELNRGEVPDNMVALAMGDGFLSTCFFSDLIFENRVVPLVVHTDDPSGYTKLTWDLGGFPMDIDKFFDDLHSRGVVEAQKEVDPCVDIKTVRYPANDCDEVEFLGRTGTLAHLLDRRAEIINEPTAGTLPQTINPLEFLIQNVLRNNAFIIRMKAASSGSAGVGLQNVKLLRKVAPPHTAMLLVVDLTAAADSVNNDNFEEQVATFSGMEPLSDTVPPDTLIDDLGPTIRTVSGTCL